MYKNFKIRLKKIFKPIIIITDTIDNKIILIIITIIIKILENSKIVKILHIQHSSRNNKYKIFFL